MKIITYRTGMKRKRPVVATIGFFDGVHMGHQFLIDHVKAEAERSHMESVVITFDRHPREVLRTDYIPQRLSTLTSKLIHLAWTGVQKTVVMHFNKRLAAMSARDFMQHVLKEGLGVSKLIVGYDNHFGHSEGKVETFEDYQRYGRELGIEVIRNEAYVLNGVNVSSSVVRSFISEGEIELANSCLGYDYGIYGKVVKGEQEGRKIGFPTANLDVSEFGMLVPAPGVYAVEVGNLYASPRYRGMMNIGTRPTYGGKELTLEVNIFGLNEDIYGKYIKVTFTHFIRPERKFSSPKALARQLEKDKREVLRLYDIQLHQHDNDLSL